MATTRDVLAIVVTGDVTNATRELEKVGRTADRELGRAEKRSQQFAAAAAKAGVALTGAAVTAGAGLARLVGIASDLQETVSKSRQVFGDQADAIEEWASTAAQNFGQSKRAALDAASTFGAMFRAIGLGEDEVAAMSRRLTVLASDLASFANTSPEDAVVALAAALRGESEPIRRYGVLLNDATLKQKALDLGLVETTTGTLPPAIRAQAAYAAILEQTVLAQGDFQRTSNGLANQQRILRAQVEDLAGSFGEAVLPAVTSLVRSANSLISTLDGIDPSVKSAVGSTAVFATGVAAVGGAVSLAVSGVMRLRAALVALGAASGPVGVALVALGGVFAAFQARAAKAAEKVAAITDEMQRTGRGAAQATESVVVSALQSVKRIDDVTRVAGVSINQIAVAVAGTDRQYQAMIGTLKDARAELSRQEFGGDFAVADIVIRGLIVTLDRWRQAARDAGAANSDLATNITDWQLRVNGFSGAAYTATRSVGELAATVGDGTVEIERMTRAVDDARRAHLDLVDGVLASDEAIDRHGEAMDRALERIAALSSASGEDLPGAMRDARQAIRDAAVAAAESSRAFAELVGGDWTGFDAIDAQVAAIRQLRDAVRDPELVQWMDSLIRQLQTAGTSAQAMAAYFAEVGRVVAATSQVTRRSVPAVAVGDRPAGRGQVQARAAGGPVTAGRPYLVGELGPELFVPRMSGMIVPHSQTGRTVTTAREVVVTQHFHERVDPVQVAAAIAWEIR